MLAKVTAEGEAIVAGHHDVQHNQIDGLLSQLTLHGITAIRQQHPQTMLLQIAADQIANVSMVIDDQNGGRVAHSLLR